MLQFSKSIVFEVYSSFVNNFSLAMQRAKKNARSKPAFSEFLKVSSCNNRKKLLLISVQKFFRILDIVDESVVVNIR